MSHVVFLFLQRAAKCFDSLGALFKTNSWPARYLRFIAKRPAMFKAECTPFVFKTTLYGEREREREEKTKLSGVGGGEREEGSLFAWVDSNLHIPSATATRGEIGKYVQINQLWRQIKDVRCRNNLTRERSECGRN